MEGDRKRRENKKNVKNVKNVTRIKNVFISMSRGSVPHPKVQCIVTLAG